VPPHADLTYFTHVAPSRNSKVLFELWGLPPSPIMVSLLSLPFLTLKGTRYFSVLLNQPCLLPQWSRNRPAQQIFYCPCVLTFENSTDRPSPTNAALEVHDMETTDLRLACTVLEGFSSRPGGLRPDLAKGPWILVYLESNFDLDKLLLDVGITTCMVSNIAKHEDQRSYEFVATPSCVASLSTRLKTFNIKIEYDPLVPAANNIDGHVVAKRKARVRLIENAVEAVREGWGPGPEESCRSAVEKAGSRTALQGALLYWDISVSDPCMLSPIHLLILSRKPIHRSLSISRIICCSLVSSCLRMMEAFLNATKTIGSDPFDTTE